MSERIERLKQFHQQKGFIICATDRPDQLGSIAAPQSFTGEWSGIGQQSAWRNIGPASRDEYEEQVHFVAGKKGVVISRISEPLFFPKPNKRHFYKYEAVD